MLPASILRKVSAATIMMIQLLTSSHHLSLPKSELPTCAKFPAAIVNIFRLKSLGLQPEGGDTDKVTFHVEKSDEAEVGIKTLALEKKFLGEQKLQLVVVQVWCGVRWCVRCRAHHATLRGGGCLEEGFSTSR